MVNFADKGKTTDGGDLHATSIEVTNSEDDLIEATVNLTQDSALTYDEDGYIIDTSGIGEHVAYFTLVKRSDQWFVDDIIFEGEEE